MQDYWEGIHGKMVKRGQVDAPVCTTCHGEHGIISPKDPRSPVSDARVAEATCSPCHESEVLNEKYGLPAGRLTSYIDSYHGLKSKAGKAYVANCASCHGSHRILPHTDPTSSIYPANLQTTCGKCHEGITSELAGVSIHETATGIRSGWPEFFRDFYIWLIVIVIGLMILHNVADIVRHVKNIRREPYVVRMNLNESFQHWVLMLSFIVLVISGFALRFSDASWVVWIFGWGEGEGFLFRGLVHRIAAVVFAFCCVWHFLYLFGHRGKRTLRDMILAKRDFADIRDNVLFFLGRRDERPRFDRFSYMEKCEYWALVWGGVIMTGTGILLWFDNWFVDRWGLPKGVLDVVLVVHYYEAWLATLAILVWHGYSTIFSPHVYPMNPAWIGGAMPKKMYMHEHPDGPKLRARILRSATEEVFEDNGEVAEASAIDDRPDSP
jgi:cytochrome b subunit of formate dehydrogenase